MTETLERHIKIRQAKSPLDLDAIRDLIMGAELASERRHITATLAGSTYWIADLNGVPSGCIGLEHGGEGVSLIRSAVVVPEARSRGLGRALVQGAVTHASLRGDHTLYLLSTGMGDYWRRFGFEPVGTEELAAALPDAPQVRGGLTRGWLHEEEAWKRTLRPA